LQMDSGPEPVGSGLSFIIDIRESVAPQIEKYFVTNYGQKLKTENRLLTRPEDIGDLIFQWNNEPFIVIERKTLPDLISSIRSDGRYREQKKRLLAARNQSPRLRIYYLIEGQLGTMPANRYFTENHRKTAYGACVNTLVRDNIPVIRTESLPDTLKTLGKMWELLTKEGSKIATCGSSIPVPTQDASYHIPIKIKKGDNYNEDWCYRAMLQQIPGVSEDVAEAISLKYTTLPILMKAYQEGDGTDRTRKALLVDVSLPKRKLTSTGKMRTVGPVVSERIWKFLGSP